MRPALESCGRAESTRAATGTEVVDQHGALGAEGAAVLPASWSPGPPHT